MPTRILPWTRCPRLTPTGAEAHGELARWSTWAALRRVKGWLGSSVWRAARFGTRGELTALAYGVGLREISVTGAIFYPPLGGAGLAFDVQTIDILPTAEHDLAVDQVVTETRLF